MCRISGGMQLQRARARCGRVTHIPVGRSSVGRACVLRAVYVPVESAVDHGGYHVYWVDGLCRGIGRSGGGTDLTEALDVAVDRPGLLHEGSQGLVRVWTMRVCRVHNWRHDP